MNDVFLESGKTHRSFEVANSKPSSHENYMSGDIPHEWEGMLLSTNQYCS